MFSPSHSRGEKKKRKPSYSLCMILRKWKYRVSVYMLAVCVLSYMALIMQMFVESSVYVHKVLHVLCSPLVSLGAVTLSVTLLLLP